MHQTLSILQIEDSESDAALIVHFLERAGYKIHALRIESAAELRAALNDHGWDAIIADYSLPQFDAPSALKIVQETCRDIPFLVVSGVVGEDVAVAMMKSGAHDYLMKDRLARLGPAVEREIREAHVRLERRRAEEALRQSLEVSKTLLKEVHHRVKNNLQMVCSLMRLQFRSTEDARIRDLVQRMEKRIACLAQVHNLLCHAEQAGKIDLAEHVRSIASSIVAPEECPNASLSLNTSALFVNMDTAIPCGLIVNELVTNAARHAFPDGRRGTITVSLTRVNNEIVLSVADDGVGFSGAGHAPPGKSLGLRLIDMLSQQLQGTASFGKGPGTCCEVRFPAETAAADDLSPMPGMRLSR